MADLDQGGVFRETSRVYLGPSLGWSQQVSAPPVSAITVTTPGTTIIQQGVSTVHVRVNGSVTIQLYAAKGNAAGAGQVPGSFVQVTLTINDVGGFASTFPITILPSPGETIGGSTLVTIAANYGLFVLLSDVQNGGWTVASGVSGSAVADAPSDGSTYGRLNATWTKVLPLAGGTMTGAVVMAGVSTVPTPAVDTNTTQVANTAFVLGQASAPGDGTPAMEGVAARGVSTHFARADHVHPIFALRGYLSGLTLSTAGASATFSVAAGMACDSTFAAMIVLASSISKTTGAWAVGSGNGGLDTGAIAINTWYHAHLIKRNDTGVVDVLVSLSPTAPTLPTNYTIFRRIGAMKTNASSQWTAFIQVGDEFLWSVVVNDVTAANPGTAGASFNLLSVPSGITVKFNASFSISNSVSAGAVLYIDSNLVTVSSPGVAAGNSVIAAVVGQSGTGRVEVWTATHDVHLQCNNAANNSVFVTIFSWTDRRGRDA